MTCPAHDANGCELFAARILAGGPARDSALSGLEEAIWRHASTRFRERDLAERIPLFEVTDCWRHGERLSPSMERSVFLWQSSIHGEPVCGSLAKDACPVVREFFEAQRDARVSVVSNHGGVALRDALVERPSAKLEHRWPKRITTQAKPDDRFLIRMPLFRGVRMLDELGISGIVLGEERISDVRELAAEGRLRYGTPEWPWHLAAIWTTVATEDWARTALGSSRGDATRH